MVTYSSLSSHDQKLYKQLNVYSKHGEKMSKKPEPGIYLFTDFLFALEDALERKELIEVSDISEADVYVIIKTLPPEGPNGRPQRVVDVYALSHCLKNPYLMRGLIRAFFGRSTLTYAYAEKPKVYITTES